MPNFKYHAMLCVLCVMSLVLVACSDSDSGGDTPTPTPPVTSPITGQWTATETFAASSDTITTAGELTFSVTLEENAGVITTNIEAVNDVVITLTQPTATTIESRRQGDPSFVTGTLNGTQVVLEVDVDSPMQPAALQIVGTLQNDDTITGEATLELFGVTATSPITMNKQ